MLPHASFWIRPVNRTYLKTLDMRKSPNKSPENGDALAHAFALALLHVTELRQTRTQIWTI